MAKTRRAFTGSQLTTASTRSMPPLRIRVARLQEADNNDRHRDDLGRAFTGWSNTTRPMTSATTRKLSRKASNAEKASSDLAIESLILLSLIQAVAGRRRKMTPPALRRRRGEGYLIG